MKDITKGPGDLWVEPLLDEEFDDWYSTLSVEELGPLALNWIREGSTATGHQLRSSSYWGGEISTVKYYHEEHFKEWLWNFYEEEMNKNEAD